mmetsp:Transcript_5905/g.7023  ORF Transcript_5905/g.7023 Transcript_5905/m.7023 type:complete len:286 (+) Transcript_5905:303-1160(+)
MKPRIYATEEKIMKVLKILQDRRIYRPDYVQMLRNVFKTEEAGGALSDSEANDESQEDSSDEEDNADPKGQLSRLDSAASIAQVSVEQLLKTRELASILIKNKEKWLEQEKASLSKIYPDWQKLESDAENKFELQDMADDTLNQVQKTMQHLNEIAAQISSLNNCVDLLTNGLVSNLNYRINDLEEKIETDVSKMSTAKDLKKKVKDLKDEHSKSVLSTVIRKKKRVLKRKHPDVIAAEKRRKEEELEAKRRQEAEESQPKFWDKLTRSWKYVPQMGGIEDWRER